MSRAVIVELVGPAGAGKTTLARGVSRSDPTVRAGLSLWNLPRPQLIRSAVSLLPTIIGAALRGLRMQWREVAQMIRLGALQRVVHQEADRHRIILLDEGPVFALSWLDVLFNRNGNRALVAWRRRVVADWALMLDLIVFLDASDVTLAHRIRSRDKWHAKKGATDAEISRFAASFRQAFDRAIAELARAGHLSVDVLSTERDPLDLSAARLRTALKQRRNGH